MGVDIYVLNFLTATSAVRKRSFGRTLLLGRQGFHVTNERDRSQAEAILRGVDPDACLDTIQPPDADWAEGLFRYFGSTSISALDASPFEGADIIHDLNVPIPSHLNAVFDTIFDGGTLEHIFDVPEAMRNVAAMLDDGGLFLSVNGANNQLGHGLYQFSPELMWRAFGLENGFKMEAIYLVPQDGKPSLQVALDPRATGKRIEVGATAASTYLAFAARRSGVYNHTLTVYQSDYSRAWTESPHSQLPRADSLSGSIEGVESADFGKWARVPAPVILRAPQLHNVWRELRESVEHCATDPLSSHPFMDRLFHRLGSGRELLTNFVRQCHTEFEKFFIASNHAVRPAAEIPQITHRIWITTPNGAFLPPEAYIDSYLEIARILPPDTIHFFWTNSDLVARHVKSKAQSANVSSVWIMEIDSLRGDTLFERVLRLVQDRKYVLAADILKIMILHRFGGIYCDMGVTYDRVTYDLIRCAEYCFFLGNNKFFQTCFVASTPRSELLSIFLAILNHPACFDRSIALTGSVVGSIDEVHVFAGLGFTACALLFLAPTARVVILPPQSHHLTWRAQQSWYGKEPKNGNALVENTSPTVLTSGDFLAADQEFEAHVKIFGNIPLLREQVRILLLTHPYFLNHPTAFCQAFFAQGSDKARSWHNYGYVYNYLLRKLTGHAAAILEVGIGTNHIDMASNMGASGVPGASLRAWKELFPSASVVGADLDRRVLFKEEGIETYFVDQTDSASVRQLFEEIGNRKFGLIVDDGLHTFDANRVLFENAVTHLSDRGVYIIEDVRECDIPAWTTFLATGSYQAVLLRLPHPTNTNDNCIIIICAS